MTMLDRAITGAIEEHLLSQAVGYALTPVEVTPEGYGSTISWRGVAGATDVRLDHARVTVYPGSSGSGRSIGVAAAGRSDVTEIDVVCPERGALVRSITIADLQVQEDGRDDKRSVATEGLGGFRLVLAPVVNGTVQAPTISVPALPARNALPAQLAGGSLSGTTLSLPDVAGDRFRVTIVTGDAPQDFASRLISHGDVVVHVAPGPTGLHVTGPDGNELYARSGPILARETVDVSAALQRYLGAAATQVSGPNAALAASITIRSDVRGEAAVDLDVTGTILRSISERLSAECEGAPATIDVPAPHPGRPARRTVADITVTHHGAALHPLSNALPTGAADLGGPVVGDTAVVRALPPQALAGERLARIGVVGWPRGATDLALRVLGRTATVTDLVGAPGRSAPLVVWFVFEEPIPVDAPVQLSLTASRGAFGWVATPDPAIRIATASTPDGQRVTVGGHTVTLTGAETRATATILDGSDRWTVTTDQFCTVSLANAVMEFEP